jgi:hypothetical protein
MEHQQSFSSGLLYSVSPENFANLHLQDETERDGFEWQEYERQYRGDSFQKIIFAMLKLTATKWGLRK